jgi:hypothetical protein
MHYSRLLSVAIFMCLMFPLTSYIGKQQEALAREKATRPILVAEGGFHDIRPQERGDLPARLSLATPPSCDSQAKKKLEIKWIDVLGEGPDADPLLKIRNAGDRPIYFWTRSLLVSRKHPKTIGVVTFPDGPDDLLPPGQSVIFRIRKDAYLVAFDIAYAADSSDCKASFAKEDMRIRKEMAKYNLGSDA